MPATRLTSFRVDNFTAFNGGVAFSPGSGDQRDQLWVSDGSQAGTRLVKDLGSSDASSPSYLTVVGGQLLFAADDGKNGRELWRSDGSSAGTMLVRDVNPGSASGLPASFSEGYRYVTAVNGSLFFAGTTATGGMELWKSDGSTAGTVLVKDIEPGSSGGQPYDSYPYKLTAFGRSLLFVAYDAKGAELWKSDGSTAGTVLLRDIEGGSYGSYPGELTVAGATLFFAADDSRNGRELWKSDGTSRGTVLVANLDPGSDGTYGYGSDPSELTAVGCSLFFLADSGSGEALWISDGTATGTRRVGTPGSFAGISDLTAVGTTLFFVATDSSGDRELWKSDGSTAGTVRVADIRAGGSSNPDQLTAVGDSLYLVADNGSEGRELWRSDGTAAGTVLVQDLNPGSASSNPSALTPSAGRLYFNATGNDGDGLWQIALPSAEPPPRLQSVTISGATALISLDQAVNAVGGSLNAAFFQVLVGGVAVRASAASLDASGTLLSLTLASAPAATAITDVFYCPPAGATSSTLVTRSGGTAMQPQTLNQATVATSFRSSASVSGLADPYTNLELLGSAAINGNGNAGANRIRGNGATNVLNGLAGLDDIDGREGGDIYLVTSAADRGQGAEFRDSGSSGIDEVRFAATSTAGGARLVLAAGETGLERVVIGTGTGASATTSGSTALEVDASASSSGLALIGNDGANHLIGTAYADSLNGNRGNDTLAGGGGGDSFEFRQAPGSGNRDTLTDFTRGSDRLTFSRAALKGLGTGSTLSAAQLLLFSGGTPSQTSTTRFLFNTSTSVLSYDADGSASKAAPVEVALLSGVTTLSAGDFSLIA